MTMFDDELMAPMIQCRVDNGTTDESDTRNWDDLDWMEWQTNHLSAAVLMPKTPIIQMAKHHGDKLQYPPSMGLFVAQIFTAFDVSITAATNRLKGLGILRKNDHTDYSYTSALMDFAGIVDS